MSEDKSLEEHLKFIEEESFGTELFKEESKLLKIIIAPLSLSQNKPDYQELRGWLESNTYPGMGRPWQPFLNGVRSMNIPTEVVDKIEQEKPPLSVALLFHNATISFCERLEDKRVYLKEINYQVKEILKFASKFYEKTSFSEPVRIYLQLTNMKGLEANLGIDEPQRFESKWDFLSKIERTCHNENFTFTEETTGKDIIESPIAVAKKISNRLVQAFGLWEAPPQYFGKE